MEQCNATKNPTTRRTLPIAYATALAAAFTLSLPQAASAVKITPPPVPDDIRVPVGNEAFLLGHGVGTQNYVCLPSGSGFAWTLFTPEATLFNDDDKQLTTHFFSPNPFEDNKVRATWQHSRDTSTTWGEIVIASTDSAFVAPGAIAWLRLETKGLDGPDGGDTLAETTFVQRVNTAGGVAPPTGCSQATDVGHQAFIPYAADYIFYKGQYQ